jgi:hypothetical protein
LSQLQGDDKGLLLSLAPKFPQGMGIDPKIKIIFMDARIAIFGGEILGP